MSGMRNNAAKLFFDLRSPYCFISFESLLRYRVIWPMDVSLRPATLQGVQMETPHKMSKERATYLEQDVHYLAKHYSVPLAVPKDLVEFASHVQCTKALKLIVAAQKAHCERLDELIRKLFAHLWIDHRSLDSREELEKVVKLAGVERSLLDKLDDPALQKQLDDNAAEARQNGAFDLPWTTVTKADGRTSASFRGADRLNVIGDFIEQHYQGPLRHLSLF